MYPNKFLWKAKQRSLVVLLQPKQNRSGPTFSSLVWLVRHEMCVRHLNVTWVDDTNAERDWDFESEKLIWHVGAT